MKMLLPTCPVCARSILWGALSTPEERALGVCPGCPQADGARRQLEAAGRGEEATALDDAGAIAAAVAIGMTREAVAMAPRSWAHVQGLSVHRFDLTIDGRDVARALGARLGQEHGRLGVLFDEGPVLMRTLGVFAVVQHLALWSDERAAERAGDGWVDTWTGGFTIAASDLGPVAEEDPAFQRMRAALAMRGLA